MDHRLFLIKEAISSSIHPVMERPFSRSVLGVPTVQTEDKQRILDALFDSLPPSNRTAGLGRRAAEAGVPRR